MFRGREESSHKSVPPPGSAVLSTPDWCILWWKLQIMPVGGKVSHTHTPTPPHPAYTGASGTQPGDKTAQGEVGLTVYSFSILRGQWWMFLYQKHFVLLLTCFFSTHTMGYSVYCMQLALGYKERFSKTLPSSLKDYALWNRTCGH